MTDSKPKLDFASAAWIDEARVVLEELVGRLGEDGRSFSVCEIFANAPRHVAASGTAAWHFYIDGRTVRVGAGVANDVDVTIRADYEAALPAARLVYTAEILAERARARPAPSPVVSGDMNRAPAYLVELHNRLAAVTA